MPRYEILGPDDQVIDSIICPAEQIALFTPLDHVWRETSPRDIMDDTALRQLRKDRDQRLADSDWIEVSVLPVTTLADMRVYRDRLRDLTDTIDSPHDVLLPYVQEVTAIDVDALSPTTWHNMINRERDRRIAERFVFRGQHYDFDAVSKARLTGAATLAGFAIAQGVSPSDRFWHGGQDPFAWIAADNSIVVMTAPDTFALGQAAAAHEAAHVFAARAIKDCDPRPADWFEDARWPNVKEGTP
jgi:hypothetical protein